MVIYCGGLVGRGACVRGTSAALPHAIPRGTPVLDQITYQTAGEFEGRNTA